MKSNTPISQVIAQLQNLSNPEKAKELINQFSAGLKENGIEIPEAVLEMPDEMDRLVNDPNLSTEIAEHLETLAGKMKEQPGSIQDHLNVMCQEMLQNIDEVDPEITAGIKEQAKASATNHIQAALKNIQIGRKK